MAHIHAEDERASVFQITRAIHRAEDSREVVKQRIIKFFG